MVRGMSPLVFCKCDHDPVAGNRWLAKLLGSIHYKGDLTMGKLKPHKGLLKRVKVTAGGRVKFKRAGSSHLNSHMSGSKIRELRQHRTALGTDIQRLERMLHRPLTKSATRRAKHEK